jgi:hypothetical protein
MDAAPVVWMLVGALAWEHLVRLAVRRRRRRVYLARSRGRRGWY